MQPYGNPRVRRRDQRRALRGIPTGRRPSHPVKTQTRKETRP